LVRVSVRSGEPIERALKRFKRKVEQAGILKDFRKKEHFVKPSLFRKLKSRMAESRNRKREKRLLQKGVMN